MGPALSHIQYHTLTLIGHLVSLAWVFDLGDHDLGDKNKSFPASYWITNIYFMPLSMFIFVQLQNGQFGFDLQCLRLILWSSATKVSEPFTEKWGKSSSASALILLDLTIPIAHDALIIVNALQ